MNITKKIKFIICFLIFINLLLCVDFVLAADENSIKMDVQIPIGNFQGEDYSITNSSIGNYIQAVYKYAVGIVGILATAVMMWGGFSWIIAGGNAERIGEAKSWITAALSGLVLVLTSYTILYFVNPKLLEFNSLEIAVPNNTPKSGCCYTIAGGENSYTTTKDKCTGTFYEGYIPSNDECVKEATETSAAEKPCGDTFNNNLSSCSGYCAAEEICKSNGTQCVCENICYGKADDSLCGDNNKKECQDGECVEKITIEEPVTVCTDSDAWPNCNNYSESCEDGKTCITDNNSMSCECL